MRWLPSSFKRGHDGRPSEFGTLGLGSQARGTRSGRKVLRETGVQEGQVERVSPLPPLPGLDGGPAITKTGGRAERWCVRGVFQIPGR